MHSRSLAGTKTGAEARSVDSDAGSVAIGKRSSRRRRDESQLAFTVQQQPERNLLVGSSVVVRSSVVVGSTAMDGILRGAPGMVPVTRGPTSSMSEAPPALGPPTLSRGGGSQYWVDHADMASVDSLFLEDSTKAQIEALFKQA